MAARGLRVGLRPLACSDCPFGSRRGHGHCLSWMLCVVRCLYSGPIPRPQRSHRVCVCVCVLACMSLGVIRCNNNPLHLQSVGRKRPELERKIERRKERFEWVTSKIKVRCLTRPCCLLQTLKSPQPEVCLRLLFNFCYRRAGRTYVCTLLVLRSSKHITCINEVILLIHAFQSLIRNDEFLFSKQYYVFSCSFLFFLPT